MLSDVPSSDACVTSGVYKQWNGMVEWIFFKVQYHFLHPNKYNSSPYVSK